MLPCSTNPEWRIAFLHSDREANRITRVELPDSSTDGEPARPKEIPGKTDAGSNHVIVRLH